MQERQRFPQPFDRDSRPFAMQAGTPQALRSIDALLQPRSIALVGASDKPETLGRAMVDMMEVGSYKGTVYAVNPKYDRIGSVRCFSSIAELPQQVDHVVLGVGNERLDAALDAAISGGARAATIFASCTVPGDNGALRDRLATKARGAGMAICGGNCMGFYNNEIGLRVAGYPALQDMPAGSVGWIAQSGSVFGALAHNDHRLKFGLAVSSGAEIVTTAADYLGWMVARDSIRVVGMFLESVRDPEGFVTALELAASRNVPVVVLKVGRTAASAEMALTHTGAIAGSDAAYGALFRRYGVIQVDDEDELAATLLMFQQPRRPSRGGLVAIHDSGGERELAADVADRLGVGYPELSDKTKRRIAEVVDPELIPSNPLDAWGGAQDFRTVFTESFKALIEDDNAAVGVMFCNIRDNYYVSTGFTDAAIATHRGTEKPVAVATNYSMVRHDALVSRLTAEGVPVIDGTTEALKAVKHFLAWRDRPAATAAIERPAGIAPGAGDKWRRRLGTGVPLEENAALSLLSDYGIPTPRRQLVSDEEELIQAASRLSYPLALKTAVPGILHKSDVGGVVLGIADAQALSRAYADMRLRLGAPAMIAEMSSKGVELALGAVVDPQWGAVIIVSAGGVLMELLDDKSFALAPVSPTWAESMVASLKIHRLLGGYRGSPSVDLEGVLDSIVRLSWLAADLKEFVSEIDVNPLIVNADGCIAVDALVIPVASDRD